MIKNEKIRAAEVELTGLDGEELGIVPTEEALAMAKRLKVDLVCTSLLFSPPPCRLIGAGAAREQEQQARKREKSGKLKEIRLTPRIEEHDYETKKLQAERLLAGGGSVQLTVRIQGKEGAVAKTLLERLAQELASAGRRATGIQLSGKQAAVRLDPVEQAGS
ncbi:translation initiation factor IF-3 [Paenibacillus sp. J31TS4]|uniref:translation initiation factor IF-3 n=1 Tax=Paenibacillus sp. J31TS4 TaxID=2807195 RepID=UPI001B2415B6|nr:translation initiation factor IF-3 [Paenibacillus sp. J31TS4]GIP39365.1 translation initiation factor IF-3 [Paenibacillus sp. J31TS4]